MRSDVMKLFTAGFITESCDFNPISTTAEDWFVERPKKIGENVNMYTDMLWLFREMAEAKGWDMVESICSVSFPPGGRTVRSAYENLRSTILDDLRQAMPIDGILLRLYGATLAHEYDDCEGGLLECIRDIKEPDIPIGVELDPHCHMSDKMMNNATATICYKTFLHYD